MGPLTGRLLPSQSLGVGPPHALVLETWVRVNLILPALLATALLPFGIKLSLPQNSSGGAFASIHQRPVGLVPWWWLAKRGITLSPNQETSFGELPPSLTSHVAPGVWWIPWGPSNGGYFLHGDLFGWNIGGGGQGISRNGGLTSKIPPVGPHCPRQYHCKKKCTVPSSYIIPGQTPPKGMVDLT